MKKLTAVKFRILLSVLLVTAISIAASAFFFGYKHLQTIKTETQARQAAATSSKDSISNLQQLQAELRTRSEAVEQLNSLRSTNSLPQFDTENSLRTLANQLGIPVRNIVFVNGSTSSSATGSSGTSEAPSTPTQAWGGSRNSRISFEFARSLSYEELIRFLDAVETSTPKLKIEGVSLPAGSSRGSISLGTLTLEMATQ